MTYACASVSNCLVLMIFTCTDLLGALLGPAGSNVGVRHSDVCGVCEGESTRKRVEDVVGDLMC
jgi:hypothetical protein